MLFKPLHSLRATPRRAWFVFFALTLTVFAYLLLFRDALIDDAFLTLRYVETLYESGTWGFYAHYPSNTATSPLNVLLLTAFTFITRAPLESVLWLTLIQMIVLAWLLREIATLLGLPLWSWLVFVAFSANPLLMSTLGLESILFTTLFVAAIYFYLKKRFDALALTCALLTLTRAEGILVLLVFLFLLPSLRARIRALVLFALLLAPWYLFSWIRLGSFLPDTFIYKTRQSWGTISFWNGMMLYARRFPLEIFLTFFFLPFAALAWLRPVRHYRSLVLVLVGATGLHFLGYTLLRVPPYHWYYVPEVVGILLLGALTLAAMRQNAHTRFERMLWTILVALAFLIPLGGILVLIARGGVPLREAFIHTNWATPAQYRAAAEWVSQNQRGATIRMEGEVGTLAYFCDCQLLDPFGERAWFTEFVERQRAGTDPLHRIWQVNFFWYKPQPYFPDAHFVLRGYNGVETVTDPYLTAWRISSKWVRHGWLTFSAP